MRCYGTLLNIEQGNAMVINTAIWSRYCD